MVFYRWAPYCYYSATDCYEDYSVLSGLPAERLAFCEGGATVTLEGGNLELLILIVGCLLAGCGAGVWFGFHIGLVVGRKQTVSSDNDVEGHSNG